MLYILFLFCKLFKIVSKCLPLYKSKSSINDFKIFKYQSKDLLAFDYFL